jgi:hypothetical protein
LAAVHFWDAYRFRYLPLSDFAGFGFKQYESLSSMSVPSTVSCIQLGCSEECESLSTVTFAHDSVLASIGIGPFRISSSLPSMSIIDKD